MSNNKTRKSLIILSAGLAIFFTSDIVLAGPLDRGEMQPRQNPTSNNMIRVPGVLGQSEKYALETLQRAGLNVKTRYISKSMKKYTGKNGTAVKQIPSAGGLAMLGSAVTITVYKVEGEPIVDTGGGYGGAGSSYGSDGYDPGGSANGSYDDAYGGAAGSYGSEGYGPGDSDDDSGYAEPGSDGRGESGSGYGSGEMDSGSGSWGSSNPKPDW